MNTSYPPTIADVAQRAGVSIATVSRVLNQAPVVTPETVQRVRLAISELDYVPRAAARILASRKTNTIGLLLPAISGEFFQPMLRGIELAAREAGYDLFIHTTQSRPGSASPRSLGEHNADGLIVFTDSLESSELERLHRLGFPLVLMHQSPPGGLSIPVVTVENKEGARQMVDHLVRVHDRRRIAYLRGPAHQEDSTWRERGYAEALESAGIALDPELIAYGGFDRHTAAEAVKDLLARGVSFDAVFSGDDESAVGVLQEMQAAGRRVPQDVAVVGFDDISLAAYLSPPLTTVHAPIEQVGQRAAELLMAMINDKKESGEAASLLLPTQLVVRQSCGCA